MQTVNVNLFKDTVLCSLKLRCWSNARRVRINQATAKDGNVTINVSGPTTDEQPAEGKPAEGKSEKVARNALRVSKPLIIAPEFDAIKAHLSESRKALKSRTVPSYFADGICLVKQSIVTQLDAEMSERRAKLVQELVPALIAVYDIRKRETIEKITSVLYDPAEYPPAEILEQMFDIKWNWIAVGVPENLPRELFEIEKAKAEAQWRDAQEQITSALRISWQKLIEHLVDRLTPNEGGEKKVFRDTAIENIQQFIKTFSDRNIVNDTQLEALVIKARDLTLGVTPKDVRKDDDMRVSILNGMQEIKGAIDQMIIDQPMRAMQFEDEPETAQA